MIITADAIQWAKEYKGDLFHALICDPPYHLTTITKRFGKEDSAPAKFGTDGVYQRSSTGFMGKSWDGGDIAFQSETWEAFYNILHPGAFGMAFGGNRTAHRMAVAIEDAGFIIHPIIFYCFGSGFPKATRVKRDGEDVHEFSGHRYGLQALKPAGELIIVFQKPYKGRSVDCITETGAGALNIDGGRIGLVDIENHSTEGKSGLGKNIYGKYENEEIELSDLPRYNKSGRWPANFLLTHSAQCSMMGYRESDSYQINRFTDGAKPFGDGAGHEFESEEVKGGRVPVWECVDGCPANSLGDEAKFFHQSHWAIENADPFVYQAKVSVSERNAGLSSFDPIFSPTMGDGIGGKKHNQETATKKRNVHPTLKPIALIEHLATLLLPPKEYAPRRVFIPFAGVASEVIGCWRAGWEEITGIELEAEYAEIGKARLEYWKKQGIQLNLFEN